MSLLSDFRFALRSLSRVKGLAITVIVTLALGIGANAAIFSVVRGVLLRPLANRDEDRLIYIRQSAPGIGVENATFSVPELRDLRGRIKTLSAFGDFSTIGFTMVGLGEPRVVRAGVVGGSYFEVMGLRPVLGRLLTASDDGPQAAGAAVLTHRFWTTTLRGDPSVIGKTVRLGTRSATIVGVLEPSVPYPAETEIIANVVTSPHHLDATMVEGRVHRMTELFGRLAPGADLDAARAELRAAHGAILAEHPASYSPKADFRIDAKLLRDQITSPARTVLLVLLAASALVFIIACSNVANLILARSVRREGELAIRAALGTFLGTCARSDGRRKPPVGWCRSGHRGGRSPGVCSAATVHRCSERIRLVHRRRSHHDRHQSAIATLRRDSNRRVIRAPGRRWNAADDPDCPAGDTDWLRHAKCARRQCACHVVWTDTGRDNWLLQRGGATHL
jgi:putative ABC transport system permease protein